MPASHIGSGPSLSCKYHQACRRYLESINLPPESYFNGEYDYCYCDDCHKKRGDRDVYPRGQPSRNYELPRQWARFGLRITQKLVKSKLFQTCHRCFHGTLPEHVKSILIDGGLRIPGDKISGGVKELTERNGHFNDECHPEGFDTKRIFVSPSIRYAGNDAYASPRPFTDPVTKKKYKARTGFAVCIKPGKYEEGPETLSKSSYIADQFTKEERDKLEWASSDRDAVKIYGILVYLKEC